MRYLLLCLMALLLGCRPSLPSPEEAALSFSTEPMPLPASLTYREIGFAQELINLKDLVVVIGGGENPLPMEEWPGFKARFPWTKNLDRHLLFDSTAFLRSPSAPAGCQGDGCLTVVNYRDHSWIELARPVAVSFVPAEEETDMLKPEPGHLVIKTIEKCQVVVFADSIYQLSDGRGNLYAMHATEAPEPSLAVDLPAGWTLQRVALSEPLVIPPVGDGGRCYHNILGDHLGQGYHQYRYATGRWPE